MTIVISKIIITLFRSSTFSTRYMAPTHTEYSSHHTLSVVSNPNTTALAASHSRMRVIHIGKYSQPISLLVMASLNSAAWKKSASYQTLRNSVYSLLEANTVADIVTLVSNELPMNTSAAFKKHSLLLLPSLLARCVSRTSTPWHF